MDFPDENLAPDTLKYNQSKTLEYKLLYENGSLNEFPFDIIDGKKVYKRFTGLNQPAPLL